MISLLYTAHYTLIRLPVAVRLEQTVHIKNIR